MTEEHIEPDWSDENYQDIPEMEPDPVERDPNELAKIWFVVLLSLTISVYFIYELISLVLNMILFVAFKVVLPVFGVYFVLNLLNLGRILPTIDPEQMQRVHRSLMRTVSRSERLHGLVTMVFDKYTD